MSHSGKMRRGKAFDDLRDRDGNLPTDITGNKYRMDDVKYYLTNSKPKVETKSKEKK